MITLRDLKPGMIVVIGGNKYQIVFNAAGFRSLLALDSYSIIMNNLSDCYNIDLTGKNGHINIDEVWINGYKIYQREIEYHIILGEDAYVIKKNLAEFVQEYFIDNPTINKIVIQKK